MEFFKNNFRFIYILIAIGIFFRAYQPGLYIFGFDQVQILTNAESIVQGNLTLIGPRTGPAEMFTGPLVYYITALLLFILDSPWAIVGMSTLISAVTAIVVYRLLKKYTSEKSALVFLIIWAFSPFLISFDRTAWNPNLTLLASSLVFFPILGILKQKKVSNQDLIYIALGSFLGFQAHFSGLLLPFILVVTLILFKKFSLKAFLASGIGLGLSIFPSLLFDFRNGWLNSRGLFNFVSEKESVGGTMFFERFVHSLKVNLEIIGSLIPFQLDKQVSIFIGLMFMAIIGWMLFNNKFQNKKNTFVSLFWFFLIIFIFSIYRSKSPEYYFFISLPAIFAFMSDIFVPIIKHNKIEKSLITLIFLVLSSYTLINFQTIAGKITLNIGHQMNLASDVVAFSKRTPVSKIAYDFLTVDTLGMKYFIDDNLVLAQNGKTVHISHSDAENPRYGKYGLWVDPRVSLSNNYLVSDNVIIHTPGQTRLLEDRYKGDLFGPFEAFQVFVNDNYSGDTLVLVQKIEDPFAVGNETFRNLKNLAAKKETEDSWKPINYQAYRGFLKEYETFMLVYVTQKQVTEFSPEFSGIIGTNIQPGVL